MEKNFNCPECGSDRTSRAKVLYESGTEGSRALQSELAKKLSPPAKPSGLGCFIMSSIFIFVFGLAFIERAVGVFFIFFIIALVIMAAGIKENAKGANYNDEYAKWECLWYCGRCGHTFYIQPNPAEDLSN